MIYSKTVKVEGIFLLIEFNSETEKFTIEKFYKRPDITKNEKTPETKTELKTETKTENENENKKVKRDFFLLDEE